MIRFKKYIHEMAFKTPVMDGDDYEGFVKNLKEWAKEAQTFCARYSNEAIIWRGVNKKGGYGVITKATNKDRGGYMGKILPQVKSHIEALEQKFKIGTPVFTIRDGRMAKFFGRPYVFIPNSDYTALWSDRVEDSAHLEGNEEHLYDSYQKIHNKLPPAGWSGEIIFDTDEYLLVDIEKIKNDLRIKTIELETYNDISDLLDRWVKRSR